MIEKHFASLALNDQDILGNEECWSKVLALVPDSGTYSHNTLVRSTCVSLLGVQDELAKLWKKERHHSSSDRWSELQGHVERESNGGKVFFFSIECIVVFSSTTVLNLIKTRQN